MPNSHFKLPLPLLIIGVSSFFVLTYIFYYTYTNIVEWRQATREGSQSREIILDYLSLQNSIIEVKSTQQAYMISSNTKYLQSMNLNIVHVDSIWQKLAFAINNNPAQILLFTNLRTQIDDRRKMMRQSILDFENLKQESQILKNRIIEQEYRQTEIIIANIEILKQAQIHNFLLIKKNLWGNSDSVIYWLPIIFVFCLTLILVTILLFVGQMKLRHKALNQIWQQNQALETTVQDRTQILNTTLSELQETHSELQNSSLEQEALLEKLKDAQNAIDLAFAATGVVVWTFDYIKLKVEWGAGKSSFFKNVNHEKTAFDTSSIEEFSKYIIAEDLPKIQQAIEYSRKTRELHQVEYRLLGPDKMYWIESRAVLEYDAQDNLIAMRGVMINRTESKKTGEQLQKANILFESVFDSVADALFLSDLESGQIINYNQKAIEMFEISNPHDLISNQELDNLNNNNQIFDQNQQIIDQIRTKGVFSKIYEFENSAGKKFWGNTATTLTYQDRYLLTRISDISERIQFEIELVEQQKNLEQALKIIEKDNLRKSAELEETRKLQISMMPDKPPVSEFLTAAIYTQTCTEVGGDYYDYYQHSDKSITFVLGDATGHGLKASIVVATVKSYFQNLALLLPIGQLMAEISKGIQSLQIRAMYMGLQIFHISHNKLIYVSAGMPSFLIYRSKIKQVEKFTEIGLFLGYDEQRNYVQKETSFDTGDILFAFTDGLEEYFNPQREEFGINNIIKNVHFSGIQNHTAEELIENINKSTEIWSESLANQDDITLLTIKSK